MFLLRRDGQSLIEILIAVAIFTTVVGAITIAFSGGQIAAVDAEKAINAGEYAIEGREALRSIASQSWGELTDGNHGLEFVSGVWGLSSESDARGDFTRTIAIATLDSNTKIATTTISWVSGPFRNQKTEIVEQLMRWDNPVQGVCKIGPLTGNWANPQSLGSGDIGPGNAGTDIVVKLPYAFLSGVATSANKPDIFVFDVSNPSQPSMVRSLDIGSGGINSLFLKGNYLYAASSNNSKELIIFDISNPLNINQAGFYNLPEDADAVSVYAFSNTVAIGRVDTATNELAFLDVSTPTAPQLLLEASIGGNIYDFTASGDSLYFVSQKPDSDVWVYDITDPASPVFVTSYDIPNTTGSVGLFIQESFVDESSFNLLVGNTDDEFIVIGATTTQSSGWYVRDQLNVVGDPNDIVCVEGNLAFIVTTNSNKEFAILDISNPDNIYESAYLNFPQSGSGIDFADNKVYMSVRSNDSLRIITAGP